MHNHNKIVAVDVDDVCIDLIPETIKRYNKKYQDHLLKEDIVDWDISKFVKKECGNKIFQYFETKSIYTYAKQIPGSLEAINWIKSKGIRAIFVTAGDTQKAKQHWLIKHGFIQDNKDFVIAYDKSLIKADMLIDDKYDNIVNFDGIGILMTQPWNLKYDYKNRISGWKEFMEKVAERNI